VETSAEGSQGVGFILPLISVPVPAIERWPHRKVSSCTRVYRSCFHIACSWSWLGIRLVPIENRRS